MAATRLSRDVATNVESDSTEPGCSSALYEEKCYHRPDSQQRPDNENPARPAVCRIIERAAYAANDENDEQC